MHARFVPELLKLFDADGIAELARIEPYRAHVRAWIAALPRPTSDETHWPLAILLAFRRMMQTPACVLQCPPRSGGSTLLAAMLLAHVRAWASAAAESQQDQCAIVVARDERNIQRLLPHVQLGPNVLKSESTAERGVVYKDMRTYCTYTIISRCPGDGSSFEWTFPDVVFFDDIEVCDLENVRNVLKDLVDNGCSVVRGVWASPDVKSIRIELTEATCLLQTTTTIL